MTEGKRIGAGSAWHLSEGNLLAFSAPNLVQRADCAIVEAAPWLEGQTTHRAPRIPHVARRRGGSVAARNTRAQPGEMRPMRRC